MNAPAEISLETARGKLAGLRQLVPDGPRVLCLHGWLDNAASFVPLMNLWPELDLVSLDLPGHGRSAHRHPEASYYFTEYLLDVYAAMDALGWPSCHLVGHSMGGAISVLFAAAAPERVRSLVLLDVLGPITARPENTAERLRKSIKASCSPRRPQKPYSSIEEMIKIRQVNSELSENAARLICERSALKNEDHHVWSNDPALHWVSPILMTEEQALNCLRNVNAPVLALIARPLPPYLTEQRVNARADALPEARLRFVEGNHHFHMHKPEAIASSIESFILEHHSKNGQNHE